MDFQNRVGSKTGGGGQASYSESNRDRRERLAQLAAETIDLAKDPYFMRNHLGTYECKLCLTLHNNEASYLAHTQGKKHQSNLARRAAKEAKEAPIQPSLEKPRYLLNLKFIQTRLIHIFKIYLIFTSVFYSRFKIHTELQLQFTFVSLFVVERSCSHLVFLSTTLTTFHLPPFTLS